MDTGRNKGVIKILFGTERRIPHKKTHYICPCVGGHSWFGLILINNRDRFRKHIMPTELSHLRTLFHTLKIWRRYLESYVLCWHNHKQTTPYDGVYRNEIPTFVIFNSFFSIHHHHTSTLYSFRPHLQLH